MFISCCKKMADVSETNQQKSPLILNASDQIIPDVAKITAIHLSNIFYDETQSASEGGDTIIRQLQRWCLTGNKCQVCADRDDLITLISFVEHLGGDDVSSTKDENLQQEDLTQVMLQHHTARQHKFQVKKKLQKIISSWERNNFEETFPVHVDVHPEISSLEKSNIMFREGVTRDTRMKRIKLGYAMLNLQSIKSRNVMLLVKNLIADVRDDLLLQEEAEFVEYLFDCCSPPVELRIYLLSRFSFLYEKRILKLCVSFLRTENEQVLEDATRDQVLCEILSFPNLVNKIDCMLFNLYVLSNYDKAVLRVQHWFKTMRDDKLF